MAIDYYELTLIGTHSNSTIPVGAINQSSQTVSYKYVLSEGNYTAASITAIDLCGQRSETISLILTNTTSTDHLDTVLNVATSDTQQSQITAIGAGIGIPLGIIVVALLVILIILAIKVYRLQTAHIYDVRNNM